MYANQNKSKIRYYISSILGKKNNNIFFKYYRKSKVYRAGKWVIGELINTVISQILFVCINFGLDPPICCICMAFIKIIEQAKDTKLCPHS